MADSLEAVRPYMQQKTANELICRQCHDLLLVVVPIALVEKFHVATFDIEDSIIGDGHAMSVAVHVFENLFWAGKWRLGADDPFCLPDYYSRKLAKE